MGVNGSNGQRKSHPETFHDTEARQPWRPGRSVLYIVAVVVLLIAAIAYANRPTGQADDGNESGAGPAAGDRVQAEGGAVPTDFDRTEQGAQSAAANYAAVLGGPQMFAKESRDALVEAIIAPSAQEEYRKAFDADYSADLNERIGLSPEGKAPDGSMLVSRTLPAGTQMKSYGGDETTVSVWCSGLFGLTGGASETPVTSNWFTMTMKLTWTGGDWKVLEFNQVEGPTPARGDDRLSSNEAIEEAPEKHHGLTYTR